MQILFSLHSSNHQNPSISLDRAGKGNGWTYSAVFDGHGGWQQQVADC